MTNVSAFKIQEENKETKNIVLIADSQTTDGSGGRKQDSSQKMFPIGGSIVMHSGMRQAALDMYSELRQSFVRGPAAIAQSILDISTRRNLPANMPLDMIVSGLDENNNAKIFYVNVTGFSPFQPEKSSPQYKGMSEQFYAFSGSGSTFASRIIDGQIDLGLDPRPRDITSGVSLMKAVAQAATESVGVNDRLQYGVITPNGIHMLFHPSIGLEGFDEYNNYIKNLLGVSLEEFGEFGTLKDVASRKENLPTWAVWKDFYMTFDENIGRLNSSGANYRKVCDLHLKGKVDKDQIDLARSDYRESKAVADMAVGSLLTGKLNSVLDYLTFEQKARNKMYELVKAKQAK